MYSQEQVKQIKAIIASYLDNSAVMEKIKSKIKDQNIDPRELDDKKLLELLKDTDLFDKISKEMKAVMSKTNEKTDPQAQLRLTQSKRALLIKVGQGRAFLNYVGGNSDKKLQFYVNFLKQRYASGLVNAAVEPLFNEVNSTIPLILEFHFRSDRPRAKGNRFTYPFQAELAA